MADRWKYKQRQDEYVRSIFESDAQQLLKNSLIGKRSRTIARYWRHLRADLADDWKPLFEQHALETARDFTDDAFADGLRFAEWVASCRKLGRHAASELKAAKRVGLFRKVRKLLASFIH